MPNQAAEGDAVNLAGSGEAAGGAGAPPLSGSPDGLVCSEVSVAFAGVRALDKVSLSVKRGEVVGLIGPNGAGKTTLLNVLSGFASTVTGSVHLDGQDITHFPPQRRARLGLERTFQHGRLFSGLTVRENVELGALAVRASSRSARSIADRLLANLGLEEMADLPVAQLSHGDQQHVSVARAVAATPKYLLLDEPAAGLSEGSMAELGVVIERAIKESGAGVVLIDHNVDFVLKLSDRVVVLDYGEVLAEGPADEIRRNVDVVSAYLGEAGVEDLAASQAQ
ncbi:MAG: ABC transporter ATP-binding protein [Candidatus Dormibacteria bacterium]